MSNVLVTSAARPGVAGTPVPALVCNHLVVHSAGEGPPIILLHGLTASHHEWSALKMALAQDHTCITWDAHGHGMHQVCSASPSIADLARDLATVVASLAPRKPVVVGHSVGAITVFEFLRRFGGDAFAGVVLVDQSPRMLTGPDWELGLYSGFTPADNLVFEWQMRRDPAEAYLRLLASGFNARAQAEYEADDLCVQRARERLRKMHATLLLPLWKSFAHKDYRDEAAALTVPVLVVLGGASNLYDAGRLGRWYSAAIPHAHVVRYEGADHAPHLAVPARFARDVAEFAARCTRVCDDRRRSRRPPALQRVPVHVAA
ncbi:MAG: alpha/beta hydrolase [Casimicrobiaceae bacterium]